ERAAKGGVEAKQHASMTRGGGSWIHDVLADVSQKKRGSITSETPLAELGFDSLMFTELAVAIEAAGVALPDPSELSGLETVADVEKLVARLGAKQEQQRQVPKKKPAPATEDDDIDVPRPLVALGRRALRGGMRALYERVLETGIH